MSTGRDLDFMSRGKLERDLASGVGSSDHQHSPRRNAVGPAVVDAMDLEDIGIQVFRHRWDERRLEGSGGDHDVVGSYLSPVCFNLVELIQS